MVLKLHLERLRTVELSNEGREGRSERNRKGLVDSIFVGAGSLEFSKDGGGSAVEGEKGRAEGER